MTPKMTTKVLIDCKQDYRYNLDAIDILMRVQLVNMVTYDLHLANTMENGLNFQAVNFAQRLIKLYFVEDQVNNGVLNQSDLSHTIEMLSRLGTHNRPSAEGPMANILEMLKGEAVSKASQQAQVPVSQGPGTSFDMSAMFPAVNPGNAPSGPVNATPPRPGGFMERAPGGATGFAASAAQPGGPHGISSFITGDDDPTDLQQKVEGILREWLNIAYQAQTIRDPSAAFGKIVSLMQSNGILRTDDMITRFFRLCTEMCSDLAYRLLTDSGQTPAHIVRMKCFYTLDAFVELISLLVKHSGDGQFAIKINLLTKVLGIVAAVLQQDHEVRRGDFHALPFHRILIMLFWKLTTPDPLLDPINFQILNAFCNCLHVLQPRKAAGFAYAWLDIVGHRAFIGRMLVMTPQHKAWPMYAQLIIDHLKFLVPFLRNIDLPKPIALMYKGTLRVLLVLLHDFPELLCDYHYLLCDVIPPNCVQLRNLVLSAYPRNMRLPDPFMPNLKVDQLPEISSSPRITLGHSLGQLIPPDLKADLDSYLLNRAPVDFPTDLRSKLQVSEDPGHKYNVPLMNAVVLYVGIQAIQAIQAKEQAPSMSTIAHTAYMDIFQSLAVNLDTEGRYLFFNAIANQLRYPNSHTHYFSCTLLYLFLEANLEVIQEQITRILFERLVALRPHPWGLLITFIELIKNPVYNFWQHQFVRCAPEIERLFESVAASCFAKVQQVPADRTQ